MTLSTYLPQDRLRALAHGETLPDRTTGAVLFADISGFTPLTEALRESLGPRRGAEELTRHLDAVYIALIAEVERCGGSVIGFAGDAITCWFDESFSPLRAVACAFALQTAMQAFGTIALPNGSTTALALKVAVATGPARRFVVGDPAIHYLDTLAGATVARTATAEHLAQKGDVLLDEATVKVLSSTWTVREWREDHDTGECFAVVTPPATGRPLAASTSLTHDVIADRFTDAIAPVLPESMPVLEAAALRAWVPHTLYERESSGQGAFLTEFRPCVALFVRFLGIDFDAAESEAQLDTFIRKAQAIVARYGGTVLQLTVGDKGSYAYFNLGALSTHEDDARRAVKIALALREEAQTLGFLASLQMGIAQGMMRVGAYGGPTRRTYGALGDDTNLAARLMSAATPGEILVSGRVQQAVAQAFIFEPRPPLPMKGKAEPLPVFAVTGERQQRAIRLQEPTYALPMVGRQIELQTITEKLDLVLNGQAQIIGIVAEAGMGKSRLVAEVIRTARRKGFAGFGGACQSDGVNTPYLAWKSIWSAFFDLDPAAPLRKQIRLLEGEIEDRVPSRVAALPLLSSVLNLDIPDNDFTKSLEPKDRKGALHALLEDCLKAAATDEPLLLVIEDLHWIDALSQDLLEELARATTNYPICLILAYRPPQLARLLAPRLEALPTFIKVELRELSATECEQAIRAKLAQLYPARGGAVPPVLVEKLMARAQGNPFYLEELLNFLRDRGLDPRDPADLHKIELPDSLHALILSRIDQLTEHEKMTLRVASIIGRLFRADWLPGYYPALGDLPQVKADLDELQTLDITPLDTPEPELTYLFKHIVTHEVTYESLPFATRAQLHEQLAQYLESINAPLETLAHHYGHSHNQTKQREYLHKAGDAAQAAYANDAALDYYVRLLPLLTEPREQIEIHLKRGAVLERLGDWDAAEAVYRGALGLAEQIADVHISAHCCYTLGTLLYQRGDYAVALEWLEQARTSWQALGKPADVGRTLVGIGGVFWHKGDYAMARQNYSDGLALARIAQDRGVIASALSSLGNVAWIHESDYAAAHALIEESLTLRREMGDKQGMAHALNNLGNVALYQGDYTEARALYEESLVLFREMGDKPGMARAIGNLGEAAYFQGDDAAARMLNEERLRLKRELGDKWGIAFTISYIGLVALHQGDNAAARTFFEEGLTLYREIGDKLGIAVGLNSLGNVALSQGDDTKAQALIVESLTLMREMGYNQGIVYNLMGLAGVAAEQPEEKALAAQLAGAAETLRASIGFTLEPTARDSYKRTMTIAKDSLGEQVFNAAFEAGQKMTLEEAIALALEKT